MFNPYALPAATLLHIYVSKLNNTELPTTLIEFKSGSSLELSKSLNLNGNDSCLFSTSYKYVWWNVYVLGVNACIDWVFAIATPLT